MDVRLKYRHLKDFIANHAELQVQEMTAIVREINEAGLTDKDTLTEASNKLHVMQGRGEIMNILLDKIKELENK
tara:strand:- start:522 stop:743 length:222 start_codon:yes stop_codon:yes gene_type:complete